MSGKLSVLEGIDLEAQGGDGGAQAMGEVGDQLTLGCEQVLDPVPEPIEPLPQLDDLRGTGWLHPGIELPVREPLGDRRCLDDGLAHLPGDHARDHHRGEDEDDPHAQQADGGGAHPLGHHVRRHEHPDH